jgi:hypothetical protein
LPLAGGDDALAHLPHGGRVCAGVSERDLGKRELEGDPAAQLMSGVGEETLLRRDRVGGDSSLRNPGDSHGALRSGVRRRLRFVMRQAHQRNLNGSPLRMRGGLELA